MLRAYTLRAGLAAALMSGALGMQQLTAAEFRFDQVDAGPASSLEYTVDGITATATGTYISPGVSPELPRDIQTVAFEGMGTSATGMSYMSVETLWFDFSEELLFTGAEFYRSGSGDAHVYVVGADGYTIQSFTIETGLNYLDLSVLDYTADVIGFRARAYTPGENVRPVKPQLYAEWQMVSLTGEVLPTQVVPTPAAAGLGLMGLVGLAYRRRSGRN